jgi:hypothetical protein
LEEWKKVDPMDVIKNGGDLLLKKYDGSVTLAVESVYGGSSLGIQKKEMIESNKDYFDWLAKKLKIKQLEDWYTLDSQEVRKKGGNAILNQYGGFLSQALTNIYPEHKWFVWKFKKVPEDFWKDRKNQLDFFDWLGQMTNKKTMDDWYSLTKRDILQWGGGGLLKFYDNSLLKILISVYPNHNWLRWKFGGFNTEYWEDKQNLRDVVDWISKELRISSLEDWYRVSQTQIEKIAPLSSLFYSKGLSMILTEVYPDYQWDLKKLEDRKIPIKSSQRMLTIFVREFFPNSGIN